MAIAELVAALERDAAEEERAMLEAAEASARRIAAEAAARAERRREELLAPAGARLRDDAERRLATARRGARREVLLARQRFLQRVLNEARTRLSAELDGARYRAALSIHLREALTYLGGRASIVRCPPRLEHAVRAAARLAKADRVVADGTVGSGVLVEAEDGSVIIDDTLEARLERLAPSLALDILARAGLP